MYKLYLPFPQVGPAKLVAEQSQINLFHPSEHKPEFMQGCESHCVPSEWQAGWMEPAQVLSNLWLLLALEWKSKFQTLYYYNITLFSQDESNEWAHRIWVFGNKIVLKAGQANHILTWNLLINNNSTPDKPIVHLSSGCSSIFHWLRTLICSTFCSD